MDRVAEGDEGGQQGAGRELVGSGRVTAAALDAPGVQQQAGGDAAVRALGLQEVDQPGGPELDVDQAGADGEGQVGLEQGELVVGGQRCLVQAEQGAAEPGERAGRKGPPLSSVWAWRITWPRGPAPPRCSAGGWRRGPSGRGRNS